MKRRVISSIVPACAALALLCACASTTTNETMIKEAQAHYQIGLSYLNDNNIQPAYVEFQRALEKNPNDKEALNAIGLIHLLKLEEYGKAVDFFKRALAVDKGYAEAQNNLGLAYERSGRYGEAVDAYRAAATNPLYRSAQKAFGNLGRAYYRMKKYSESVDAYKEAIRRFSDFHYPYFGLALAYNALARYDDAALALKKGIELDPLFKGDREKAREVLRERKLALKAEEERDIEDLLEIMNY